MALVAFISLREKFLSFSRKAGRIATWEGKESDWGGARSKDLEKVSQPQGNVAMVVLFTKSSKHLVEIRPLRKKAFVLDP